MDAINQQNSYVHIIFDRGKQMKMNPECVLDILFEIENISEWTSQIQLTGSEPSLLKYKLEEVRYHARECYLSGFFDDKAEYSEELDCPIGKLTAIAQEFMEITRSEKVMTCVKLAARRIPSFHLSLLAYVAKAFAASIALDERSPWLRQR